MHAVGQKQTKNKKRFIGYRGVICKKICNRQSKKFPEKEKVARRQ